MRGTRTASAYGRNCAILFLAWGLHHDPIVAGMDSTNPGDKDIGTVAEANNSFALDLYARLKEQDGNLFFSPYSISSALAMTMSGARGQTEQEMARILHLKQAREKLHPADGALIERLKAPADAPYQLRIANRLWGQEGLTFRREFLNLTQEFYGAALAQVNFAGAAAEACRKINAWAEEETAGLIKELLQPNAVAGASLVLTNAVYFKGTWTSRFDSGSTTPQPFFTAPEKSVEVPMMTQEAKFGHFDGEGFALLEMPYNGDKLSMVILLPDEVAGLPALEKSLTAESLRGWVGQAAERKIRVFAPKFELTCPANLSGPLQAMGMKDAFSDDRADFSGMIDPAEHAPIFISEVVHKAYVKVDEEGTEAAAATAVVMETTSIRDPSPVFRADHPFLFLIRDKATGTILFFGRVNDPSQAG